MTISSRGKIQSLVREYESAQRAHEIAGLSADFIKEVSNIVKEDYNVNERGLETVIYNIWFRTSVNSFVDDLEFVLEQAKHLNS